MNIRVILLAIMIALTPYAAKGWSIGPPREAPIAGDVAAAPINERGLQNLRAFARLYGLVRWFHPTDAATGADWDRVAIDSITLAESANSPEELALVLREIFAELAPELVVTAGALPTTSSDAFAGPRWQWEHTGYAGAMRTGYSKKRVMLDASAPVPIHEESLAGGVSIRLPLTAPVSKNGTRPAAVSGYASRPENWVPAGFDRSTRIAGIVIAWAALDHFYPYWDVVEIDWDAKLAPMLQDAAMAEDDRAFERELQRLVHSIEDGHGWVVYSGYPAGIAPIGWDWVENRLVITAPGKVEGLKRGSIVQSVDGRAPAAVMRELMERRYSGSEHSRRSSALDHLLSGPIEKPLEIEVVDPQGESSAFTIGRVPRRNFRLPQPGKPETIAEIEPGIVYVDLTRATNEVLNEKEEAIAAARGLVFDLRARSASSRPSYLANLADDIVRSAKFLLPLYRLPDQRDVHFTDVAWTFGPSSPRFTSNVVFLTNANAASYPESILGTVKGNRLGTIVGSPTAGANGNITGIDIPGGYRVIFTGFKVINRDGSVHHNVGVLPDVEVRPTLEGIRSGRDEVLETGLDIVRQGL